MQLKRGRRFCNETVFCALALTAIQGCSAGEPSAKQTLDEAIQTNMDKLLADKDYDEVIKRVNDGFAKSEKFEQEQGASGRMKDSTRWLLLRYRSVAWMNKDEFDIASQDLSDLLKLTPKLGWGHRCLGECYLKKRDYDKAVSSLTEAIRWDSKDQHAYYLRARSQWEKNGKQLNDNVRADYHKAHKLDPESYPAAEKDDQILLFLGLGGPIKKVDK